MGKKHLYTEEVFEHDGPMLNGYAANGHYANGHERKGRNGYDKGAKNGATSTALVHVSRTPPYSNDAEMGTLGAIMLERAAADEVMGLLVPEDFYHERHRLIFKAMIQLVAEGKSIDIITLNDAMRSLGLLDTIGGSYYLSELNMRVPTAANVGHHARIVYERAQMRRLSELGMEIVHRCYNPTADAFEELEHVGVALSAITERKHGTVAVGLSAMVRELEEYLERAATIKREVIGIPSGLKALDHYTGGFMGGDNVVIAGRTGMGKTSLGLKCARTCYAEERMPCLIFSGEMPKLQLMIRIAAAEARIPVHLLRRGKLSPEQKERLRKELRKLEAMPLYVVDAAGMSIQDMRTIARTEKRKHGIEMIVSDYLQLFSAPESDSREQEIAAISRGVKQGAVELNVPWLDLSQLNREVEKRASRRPELADLRESGAIEMDADMVLFTYRPEEYKIRLWPDNTTTEDTAEIIIAKQRQGPCVDVRVGYIKQFATFCNMADWGVERERCIPAENLMLETSGLPADQLPLPDGEEPF